MLDLLLAANVSVPFLIFPVQWDRDPRIRPWVERFIIAFVMVWGSLLVIDEFFKVDLLGM